MERFKLGDIVVLWWDDSECIITEHCDEWYKAKVISGEFDGVTFYISKSTSKYKPVDNIFKPVKI